MDPRTVWPDGARRVGFPIRLWMPMITTSSAGVPEDMSRVALVPGQPVPVVAPERPYRRGCVFQAAMSIIQNRR